MAGLLSVRQLEQGFTGTLDGAQLNLIRVALNEITGQTRERLNRCADEQQARDNGFIGTLETIQRTFETLGIEDRNSALPLEIIAGGRFRWKD